MLKEDQKYRVRHYVVAPVLSNIPLKLPVFVKILGRVGEPTVSNPLSEEDAEKLVNFVGSMAANVKEKNSSVVYIEELF